jgi:ribosomal protein S18 acetylase RimI-like enzyme
MTTLRRAAVADASQLARLQEQTFRDTFADTNTEEDMTLHCQTHYSATLQEQEISNPDLLTLVCVELDQLIGFAQLRRGAAPRCISANISANQVAEINRLYIDRNWHGAGIAQLLMDQCMVQARQQGAEQIWLGVWENNPRAIHFYRKCGFTEVGSHIFMVGSDAQRDLIMHRPL